MVNQLEYNSERTGLKIPEYGRHIQKMVDHCTGLEDAEKRQKMANDIVEIMANLQPDSYAIYDLKSKLWDQLFIMSDFKIRVKSPYKQPDIEKLSAKPSPLSYPKRHGKYRYYGQNVIKLIEKVAAMEPGDQKQQNVYMVANYMKKLYLRWNKDSVPDEVIIGHLLDISKSKISWDIKKPLLDSRKPNPSKNNHKKRSKNEKKLQSQIT